MWVQNGYRLALLVFFISVKTVVSSTEISYSASIYPETDDAAAYSAKIVQSFPEVFSVHEIAYTSDVCFQEAEFRYLLGMQEGEVYAVDIVKALFYLIKKQKFELIEISLTPANSSGYRLHFKFEAFWTFRKLKFKGIFVGKDRFRQLYLMEYGERFDERRHEDLLKKIVESLHRDGYFQASVGVEMIRDKQTKSVTVQLDLQKGSRFFVEAVDVQICSSLLDKQEADLLQNMIQEYFQKRFLKNYYAREFVNSETQELQMILARHGYLHVDIALEEHLSPTKRQVELRFEVQVSYKKKFTFEGNHFFSHQELLDAVLVFGRSTSLLPASILSEELIKIYHRKGFWGVTVDAQESGDIYHFVINEGARACIETVELRNLNHFDEHMLIKKFFLHVMHKRYYDAADVESGIEQLMAYLLREGFWQGELLREFFEPLGDDTYKMVLIFDEGKRCFLQAVTIDAYPHLATMGPFKQFSKGGQAVPFDVAIIDQQREWLMQQLQKKGYYQPKIKPECSNEEGKISLNWRIDMQDAQVKFDKTVVLGSMTFPFSYIQRELDYKIGDVWHADVLRHSVSRLKKMEVFESVNLVPDKEMDVPQKVMLLKLQKDDPFEIKMRLGLGAQHVTKSLTTGGATYRVGGSFIYKNPLNAGDQFRMDADFTRAIRLVNAQYRRPWIFGLPVTAELKGYTNRFEYPGFIGSQKNLYTVVQQGFLANFAGVYNNVDASISTGFELVDTFIDESTLDDIIFARKVAEAINFRPDLLDKNIPFFQIQPTVMLYFLDNTLNPTRGSFSVFSAKGMFPLAKLAPRNFFIRVLAEQSFFVPLMPFVCALRCRVGHIFHPQLCTIIPIERFYLGGANSIRSYETDQCPPLGKVSDAEGEDLYVPQGGRSLINVNLELRFPLYNRLGGVIFGDIGALSSNRLTEIRACDMLSGIGFGLRYNTPIGPLRFDFAWRGHKRDGVGRPYAWFLSFGNAFI